MFLNWKQKPRISEEWEGVLSLIWVISLLQSWVMLVHSDMCFVMLSSFFRVYWHESRRQKKGWNWLFIYVCWLVGNGFSTLTGLERSASQLSLLWPSILSFIYNYYKVVSFHSRMASYQGIVKQSATYDCDHKTDSEEIRDEVTHHKEQNHNQKKYNQ